MSTVSVILSTRDYSPYEKIETMVDKLATFVDWLNSLGVTQAEIAATGIVTRQAVSKLFTFQLKTVGVEMCRAISNATGLPLITVYRKAGLLPEVNLLNGQIDEIAEILEKIDPDLREDAIALIKVLKEKQKRRNEQAQSKTKRKSQK